MDKLEFNTFLSDRIYRKIKVNSIIDNIENFFSWRTPIRLILWVAEKNLVLFKKHNVISRFFFDYYIRLIYHIGDILITYEAIKYSKRYATINKDGRSFKMNCGAELFNSAIVKYKKQWKIA
jgi:hypothetical protein